MPSLSVEEVRQKRTELLEKGFTVIPGVLDREFVDELKVWADGLVSANPPNDKFRYQGSDIFVDTERLWSKAIRRSSPIIFLTHLLKKPAICRFRKKFVA